jgi:hypothetical protein
MAGHGPPPAEKRRRRNEPARGDWTDLRELEKPVLPILPKREKGTGRWSPRTRAAWSAWRSDAVTAQYGPADIQAALDLAFLYEDWVRGDQALAAEIRQRQDRLGLNPKGKRDLRWQAPREEPPDEEPKRAPRRRGKRTHLTAVK